jgi:glycerol-3-phosphate dehydrogenase
MNRADAMEHMAGTTFDVCVIGGGATGSGCALDAQLRGLNTVLVESGDFGSATSSASTKLVHGGVRYLRQAVTRLDIDQYRVVKSALQERAVMIRNAPYLAHPLELQIPCRNWFELAFYGIGMKLYDWISGESSLLASRISGYRETVRRSSILTRDRKKLAGSVVYADGQFDDARYNLALVESCVEEGGGTLNYARVTGFETGTDGKLTAALIEDMESKSRFRIEARAFVNATGPSSDTVRILANARAARRLRVSKGVHILFPLDPTVSQAALLIPKTEDGRLVFAIPWLGRLLVGTTETEASQDDEMLVKRDEGEYLLRQINPYLHTPLRLEQIVSGFAGLRPLLSAGTGSETNRLARDHEVETDATSGLISVMGGKWTTYRVMAKDTVDSVQRYLNVPVTPASTDRHPLAGSQGYSSHFQQSLMNTHGVTEATARHLVGKYGTDASEVLTLAGSRPELKQPIVPGLPPLQAQIVYGIRNERARTIEDVLARRIGLQFYGWQPAMQAAPIVSRYLAEELGGPQWNEAVEQYIRKIRTMVDSIGLPMEPTPDLE